VHVLVHLPLGLESGLSSEVAGRRGMLEGRALRAATGVLATSRWTAADLRERHGLDAVAVACPGTDAAAPSTGSSPPRLLQLASVTPLKNQLSVVHALARITDLPWTADLTGPLDVDPGYTEQVRTAIDSYRLGDRIRLTGPVDGVAWRQAWDGADLLLLPSRTETWGMVVTEALARRVPAVVGRGTGAQEALGVTADGVLPGSVVAVDDPIELGAAIRHLLGPGRETARRAAAQRRLELPGWQDTGRDVLAALGLEA
jgi:glycosyltransferase involved in cell wall biosynthesis